MLGLLNFADDWVRKGGLVVLAIIVFAESGLLVGFFLPGDSLLFFAGFLSSSAGKHVLPPLPIVAGVAAVAALAGAQVGDLIGNRLGPAVLRRPKSRFFNPENVAKAEAFFAKHGPKTIVLARFVPIVRTFVPTVAGASNMHYRKFVSYNVIGGLLWAAGVTTLGFFLGQIRFVKNNIEFAAIVIVAISIAPIVVEFLKHRKAAAASLTSPSSASSSDLGANESR